MPSNSSIKPNRTLLSDKPMVLVSQGNGRRYPVEGIYVTYLTDGRVQLNLIGGKEGHTGQYRSSTTGFSVTKKSDGRITVYFIDNDTSTSYILRPVKEDDAAWIYRDFGIPLPVEAVEQIITNSMKLSEERGYMAFAGTPSVWAFTTEGKIGAVAFNIQDVDTFFRVDGDWTRESPIEIDDTDSVTIDPDKAAEFIDRWDDKDEALSSDLQKYVRKEENK